MSVYRKDRATKGGGVLLYLKSELACEVLHGPEIEHPDTLFCKVTLSHAETCIIGIVYRPPSPTAQHDSELSSCLSAALHTPHIHLLLMGDFNLPSLDPQLPSTIPFEQCLCDLIRSIPLYNHVQEPTRFRSHNNPSTLDLIFTNEELMIEHINYAPPLGRSDHAVLLFDFVTLFRPFSESTNRYSRFINYPLLKTLILINKWSLPFDSTAIEAWHTFTEKLQTLTRCATTLKESRSKPATKIIRSCTRKWLCKRNCAWSYYRDNPTDYNWELYVSLRNRCVGLVRRDKEHF